jgi:hypothetical protein
MYFNSAVLMYFHSGVDTCLMFMTISLKDNTPPATGKRNSTKPAGDWVTRRGTFRWVR